MQKPARPQITPETIVHLINSLSASERHRVFALIADHLDNRPMIEQRRNFDNLATSIREWQEMFEKLRRKNPSLADRATLKLMGDYWLEQTRRAHAELKHTIPKRGMDPGNLETLEHYHSLLKTHGTARGKKTEALKELVTLASEQSKDYVLAYLASCANAPKWHRDLLEPVRNHVKRLESTYRKRQALR